MECFWVWTFWTLGAPSIMECSHDKMLLLKYVATKISKLSMGPFKGVRASRLLINASKKSQSMRALKGHEHDELNLCGYKYGISFYNFNLFRQHNF